jgi:hypothetical protein
VIRLPETLTTEAAECRRWAREFAGRPEQPFLLQLASAFEELAHNARPGARPQSSKKQ